MDEATTCAVIGGGPAGMMLGLLLARAGINVTVLEKHGDFLRDFRGDTVHPSTLRLLDELGMWERFAALPHSKMEKVAIDLSPWRSVTLMDFRRLRQPHPYVALVPQWDLLSLLAEVADAEPTFTLRMHTEVTGLLREGGKITGVRYASPNGAGELRAELTVACDGRRSIARDEAGLRTREFPINCDVWWFRLPRATEHEYDNMARGRGLVALPREGYMQVAYLGPKGGDAALRARGIEALRRDVVALMPAAAEAVEALKSWDDVKYLDVRLNRLRRWHTEGLVCIGDAAHAMSPVAGVGINLAVQDAVATANLLAEPLRQHRVTARDLARVRRRRLLPTAVVQAVQRVLDSRIHGPILAGKRAGPPMALLALVERMPWLAAVAAYVMGVGIRSEHAPAFARRPAPAR